MKRRSLLAAAIACMLPAPPRLAPQVGPVLLDPAAAGLDAALAARPLYTGEIGRIEGFRFIESPPVAPLSTATIRRIVQRMRKRHVPPSPAGLYSLPLRMPMVGSRRGSDVFVVHPEWLPDLLADPGAKQLTEEEARQRLEPPKVSLEEWKRLHLNAEDRYDT